MPDERNDSSPRIEKEKIQRDRLIFNLIEKRVESDKKDQIYSIVKRVISSAMLAL